MVGKAFSFDGIDDFLKSMHGDTYALDRGVHGSIVRPDKIGRPASANATGFELGAISNITKGATRLGGG